MHKFLIHKRGDHVGVATRDIESDEKVIGVYMDDDSTIEVTAKGQIPLGHKIAIVDLDPKGSVIEYGLPIGSAPVGFIIGDYVHTHNIKTLRW
ncbi:UxaA family hydrolase [Paenibacillus sp. GP183]|uniref:UxaA family hydrolase n=1 Tax=Paenibacillus sp. GP183 TaxID=1882751 RepID=UPI00089A0DEE|nr:UxaA family hydrolase [Paenibacillus sp. GP183]SEC01262.1 (2R)-sulfolactate sulfo-lyase subunit alpha [Paenibacillus sp. GP183]